MCVRHVSAERKRLRHGHIKNLLNKPPYRADELEAPVPWDQTQWVYRLPGGHPQSTGVFLVQCEDKTLVLKPGSIFSAGELFCTRLYHKLGIVSPKQRLVRGQEYSKLRFTVTKAKFVDPGEHKTLSRFLQVPFCTVQEYIPSLGLHELQQAKIALDGANQCGGGSSSSSNNANVDEETHSTVAPPNLLSGAPPSTILFQLGVMLAADILVNNGDRLPSINRDRKHNGNPGNILISHNGDVIAIDNTTRGIMDAAGGSQYLDCVVEFANQVCGRYIHCAESRVFKNLGRFLKDHVTWDLQEAELQQMREGIAEGMRRISSMYTRNPLIFGELKRDIAAAFQLKLHISSNGLKNTGAAGELVWQAQQMINVNSMKEIAKAFSRSQSAVPNS